MIVGSSETYNMFSSVSIDLAELEPKQVDHRQFPSYSASHQQQYRGKQYIGIALLKNDL
jgi:hypothetical protein